MYNSVLERYLNLKDLRKVSEKEDDKVNDTGMTSTVNSFVQGVAEKLNDKQILGLLPLKMRQRGQALLNMLQLHPQTVTWDEKGTTTLREKPIPNSNIADLVHHAVQEKKRFTPQGADEFFWHLIRA